MNNELLHAWLGALISASFILTLYLIFNSDTLRKYFNEHNVPISENIAVYCLTQMALATVNIITFFAFILFSLT